MEKKDFKNYANSFQVVPHLELGSIMLLLNLMDNPERKSRYIHVAGTNGKGSVCAYMQSILTESGLKTGKYTSPDIVSVCDRISIDGVNILGGDMQDLLEEVRGYAIKVQEISGEYPSPFEIWTAAAFLYFYKCKCDIVVLETGLGGRCDATNVIEKPIVSVFSHIALDHTEYLGDTLIKIATEKAGIIKENSVTVTTSQSDDIMAVLKSCAKEKNNKFYVCDRPVLVSHTDKYECFSYKNIKNIKSTMLGVHQTQNAALAIEVSLLLGIDERHIKTGIEKAVNIGRFEMLSDNVLFDGAHNPDGIKTLADGLNRYFPNKRKTFVMATMADKDVKSSIELLKEVAGIDEFYTVSVKDNPRSMSAKALAELICSLGLRATPFDDVNKAILLSKSELTVVCGSLYLYKDLLR